MPSTYLKSTNPHNRRMPAKESFVQSTGCPATYRLRDGRVVEIRNGCVIDKLTRHLLAGSTDAAQFLLDFGDLTSDERSWVEAWGRIVWPVSAAQVATAVKYNHSKVA